MQKNNYYQPSLRGALATKQSSLLIFFIILLCSGCNNFPKTGSARLLYSIEYRDISKDQITEYRVFDNGLVNKTILHDTSNNADLFKSEFYKLKSEELKQASEYQSDLQKLDYNNSFPWKEDFYKRANVVKFSFPDLVKPQYILDPKANQEAVLLGRVFYYYEGDDKAPELFKNILILVR